MYDVLVPNEPAEDGDPQKVLVIMILSCLAILGCSVQLTTLWLSQKHRSKEGNELGAGEPEQLVDGSSSSAATSSETCQGREGLSQYRFILGMAGSTLEWYEFGLYGLFVTEIGDTFFPETGKLSAAATSYATFAIAFFARPIGGAIFGYIGDMYGRVPSLQISLGLMVCSTFVIGVMPPKSLIGNLAPILVILARCLQGLAAGGCGGLPAVYLVECTQPNRRCFVSSLLACSAGMGTFLSSISAAVVHSVGADSTLPWRFAFIFAAVLGLTGGWASWNAEESEDYLSVRASGQAQQYVLSEVIFRNWAEILQIVAVSGATIMTFYTLFIWMPTYQHELRPPPTLSSAFAISTAVEGGKIVVMLFLGLLADHGDYVILYASSTIFLSILTCSTFSYFGHRDAEVVFAAYVPLALTLAANHVCEKRWIVELVKGASVRSTTVSIAYNLVGMFAGGSAPSLATFVVQTSWGLQGIGLYLSSACVLATTVLAWNWLQQPKASLEHS